MSDLFGTLTTLSPFVLASAFLIRVFWKEAPSMMRLKGEARVGDWQFKLDYQHDTQPK
jgi:hypothetical protein